MGYVALYRQFRPKCFADIAGQEHIVNTLKNQIKNNRISHAYLFCGPRGTGKTSAALVFAHAVNCLSPVDGDLCGECGPCTQQGENPDIYEIDAASNNGVDEIRDLRENVRYLPVMGKYKVYIIDEVHMLSQSAFNALLKTLEEPPSHVIFILATTEPHKLPATIISRCQRFDFKAITLADIVKVLSGIAAKLNVQTEESALFAIARWANGGMRDAIGLLDQCIDYAQGTITAECVNTVVGVAGMDFVVPFLNALAEGDADVLLRKIDEIVAAGKDLGVFAKDIVYHLRNIMLLSMTKSADILPFIDEKTLGEYQKLGEQFVTTRLLRSIEALADMEAELRYTTQARTLVELTFVKLCRPEIVEDIDALRDEVETLRAQMNSGAVKSVSSAVEKPAIQNLKKEQPAKGQRENSQQPEQVKKVAAEGELKKAWTAVLTALKKTDTPTYGYLRNVEFEELEEGTARITFSKRDMIFAKTMERNGKIPEIEKMLSEQAGREVKLTVNTEEPEKKTPGDRVQDALNDLIGKDKFEVID